jgi:hypothetical protein
MLLDPLPPLHREIHHVLRCEWKWASSDFQAVNSSIQATPYPLLSNQSPNILTMVECRGLIFNPVPEFSASALLLSIYRLLPSPTGATQVTTKPRHEPGTLSFHSSLLKIVPCLYISPIMPQTSSCCFRLPQASQTCNQKSEVQSIDMYNHIHIRP